MQHKFIGAGAQHYIPREVRMRGAKRFIGWLLLIWRFLRRQSIAKESLNLCGTIIDIPVEEHDSSSGRS